MKSKYIFFVLTLALSFKAAVAADANLLFTGDKAISPRLVVETFSPWVSDYYPSLIRSVDLNAVANNSNRLFCEKTQLGADHTVSCTNEGTVWAYRLVGKLKNNVFIFRPEESAETGTFISVIYRFARIEEVPPSNLMTLLRDVPAPEKASDAIDISPDGTFATVSWETFQEGKKDKIKVEFP